MFDEMPESRDNFLVHRNLDVISDMFCNDQQKEFKKLPTNLKLIKELFYEQLLPQIETTIENLEKIKLTSNYDLDVPFTSLNNMIDINNNITALNCLNNHNIKKKSDSKVIIGTSTGKIVIYDIDQNKCILEEKFFDSRIEIISTCTIKSYDSYISRVFVCARGSSIVKRFVYNHSYSIINLEDQIDISTIVNEKPIDNKSNMKKDPNITEELDLSCIPHKITISKESYFMAITTFSNSCILFMFNDYVSDINNSKNYNSGFKLLSIIQVFNEVNFEVNNFNLDLQKKEIVTNSKQIDNKDNKDSKNKQIKGKIDLKKNPKDKEVKTEIFNYLEEESEKNDINSKQFNKDKYNIKSIYNDKLDVSALQPINDNYCMVEFIQNKITIEEGECGSFSSILITTGLYLSNYDISEIKYVSLNEFINKNMINNLKSNKVINSNAMKEEDIFFLKSKMTKEERDLLAFFKKKVEGETALKEIPLKDNKIENKVNTNQIDAKNTNSILNNLKIKVEIKRLEIISRVSCMSYQSFFNSKNNFISVGLKSGCILIWDCTIHTDKHFLTASSDAEITNVCLNENFSFACSINGKIYVHEMKNGNLIYECFNYCFNNYPISICIPIYNKCILTIDIFNNCMLYYLKDLHKIVKIKFEYNAKAYDIQKLYSPIVDYSKGKLLLF